MELPTERKTSLVTYLPKPARLKDLSTDRKLWVGKRITVTYWLSQSALTPMCGYKGERLWEFSWRCRVEEFGGGFVPAEDCVPHDA